MPLFKQEKQQVPSNLLKAKFGWSPFSVLNTKSFDWQRRVTEWKKVILNSGAGREVRRYNATPTNTFSARGAGEKEAESISIFDPYLCELMYRWFSTDGATVLDPFAGGSVRGIVAAMLGKKYTGIDLSRDQVGENITQYKNMQDMYVNLAGTAEWICDDSDNALNKLEDKYDMIFTCPPYYNLEQYTTNPLDLSRLPNYSDFLYKYSSILYKTTQRLKDNSFLVIVVSEVRADARDIANSAYIGLVPDTIHILRDTCSLHYYNEIILENNIGSLPIRAPKQFDRTRKIGRHHQNILVFYKGDMTCIEEKFGKISF